MAGAPAKFLHVLAMLAKEESTYGTPVALSTTADGVQLQYPDPNVASIYTLEYAYDGSLGPTVSNLGQVLRVPPSGFSVTGDIPTRARPGGVAYSASVKPSIHVLLKAAGFDAALTTSAGTEKWTYTPTAPNTIGTSICQELYTRGEKWPVAGTICDWKLDFDNPAPPIWTFPMKGIATIPTDASTPTVTYPLQNVAPPLASSVAFTLGSFTTNAVLLSGSLMGQRSIDNPRVALSAAGAHLGFVPSVRVPVAKVVLEATALVGSPFHTSAGFDPYSLRANATQFAFSLQFGTTQYFRYKVNFPQAQVIDVVPQGNGPTATVELTVAAAASTAALADDLSIVFD